MIHALPAIAMLAIHAAAQIGAAVDINTPFVEKAGKPIMTFLGTCVTLGAAYLLVKQLHNHRGESPLMIMVEAAVAAVGGITVLAVIGGMGGIN